MAGFSQCPECGATFSLGAPSPECVPERIPERIPEPVVFTAQGPMPFSEAVQIYRRPAMPKSLRQQITDLTGVNDQGGLDALEAIMYGESPACVIAQMNPEQFSSLIDRCVDIWADRGWPRNAPANPET